MLNEIYNTKSENEKKAGSNKNILKTDENRTKKDNKATKAGKNNTKVNFFKINTQE